MIPQASMPMIRGSFSIWQKAAIARPARKIKASDVNINFLLVFIAEKKLVLLRYDNLRSHQLNKQFRFPLGELHSQIHCTL